MVLRTGQVQLSELDRQAPELLGSGRSVRLPGRLEELADLQFRGHPWARLLVGCALGDTDSSDRRGLEHMRAALRTFRRRGDERGAAYAYFILGCRAGERGDIARAASWWEKAHHAAGPAPPGLELMLAHRFLDAYASGRLPQALTMAEEAVALARIRGNLRAEATALVNFAFVQLWIGDFGVASDTLDVAEDTFAEVPDAADRYAWPLCFGARAVLHALRGEIAAADKEFARAVDAAREIRSDWYEAIIRAVRAEFTAQLDHRQAWADARWALAELEGRADQWWSAWAAHSMGVAAREAGMPDAAMALLRKVLERPQTPLERARSLLILGETLIGAGRGSDAVPVLREAAEVFASAGARYWTVRCHARLAKADPAEARRWWSRVRRAATDDPAYRILFDGDSLILRAFGPGQIRCEGHPLRVRTHNCERALFMLALAGPGGLHTEELADRLWPADFVEHRKLLGRIRTLLWEMRQVLGAQAWRLERDGPIVRFDTLGVSFDLLEARGSACTASGPAAREIADRLRGPLLTRWRYEEWVREEESTNGLIADRLVAQASRARL
jgi:tetratricopeptide (TPR) repeat protein